MALFTSFLASVWDLFTNVNVPVLNITFAQLWLGIFVVGVSIMILRPLLGIGAGAVNNILHGLSGKRGYDRAYKKSRNDNSWSGTKVTERNYNVSIHHSKPPKGFTR